MPHTFFAKGAPAGRLGVRCRTRGADEAAAFVLIGYAKAAASLPHSKGFASDKKYAALCGRIQ